MIRGEEEGGTDFFPSTKLILGSRWEKRGQLSKPCRGGGDRKRRTRTVEPSFLNQLEPRPMYVLLHVIGSTESFLPSSLLPFLPLRCCSALHTYDTGPNIENPFPHLFLSLFLTLPFFRGKGGENCGELVYPSERFLPRKRRVRLTMTISTRLRKSS